jgi:hypothetical protein
MPQLAQYDHALQNRQRHVDCYGQTGVGIREFIADTFAHHYGATINTFCDRLLAVRNPDGEICAAAGYNLAKEGSLFLERYLDLPIEQFVNERMGLNISRSEIAEVGNLAATQAGGARMLIELITRHLHSQGFPWVAFTATRSLMNSFHRMGLSPLILGPALPERVKNPAAWGSYYLHEPFVAIGNVRLGYLHLGGQQ